MNFIVFDLEATCWENNPTHLIQEIIEIGAVKLNEYGEADSIFSRFVRPKVHPNLSPFCSKLTTISQIDVNRAESFPKVIEDFKQWIGLYDEEDYMLCSWGFFDQQALEHDCRLHELDYTWTKQHISLKHQHKDIRRLKEGVGLKKALAMEGYGFSGTQHRGIDDAKNLTKLFIRYRDEWQY